MKKVKMTAMIVAATVTIGGYGLLGTACSSAAVTNNIVLSSSVVTTANSASISNGSVKTSVINGVATGEGIVINGGSSFELLSSPNGNKISDVSVGEMVTFESGINNGYYKVEVRETGDIGYLKASNIQEIYNCQNSNLENISSEGNIINVSSVVNLRYKAGLNSDILKTLTEGTNITITGKQGQWYRVSVDGTTGFIYQEYVTLNSNTVHKTTGTSSATGNTSTSNKTTGTSSATGSTSTSNKTTGTSSATGSTSTPNKTTGTPSVTGSTSTSNKTTGTPSKTTTQGVTAQNVINYAEQFEGYSYVWGGNKPSTGFDCSGFVQYVFAHFGINLPRTTFEQVNCGTAVSLSNIKPGDLVFENQTAQGPAHVGIYIGNGKIIDAAGVGQGVTISPLYNVVAVRNIL